MTDDVGRGAPRDHRHQRGLADSRSGEDAEPLTLPAGDEAVEDAHAELELSVDEAASERVRRRAVDADLVETDERRPIVDRPAESVEHPPEELVADADRQRPTGVFDERPDAQAGRVAVGEAGHAVAAERHDVGEDRLGAVAKDQAAVADRGREAGHLDRHADHLGHLAVTPGACGGQRRLGQGVKQRGHHPLPDRGGSGGPARPPGPAVRRGWPARSDQGPPGLHRRVGHHVHHPAELTVVESRHVGGVHADGGRLHPLVEGQHPDHGLAPGVGRQRQLVAQQASDQREGQPGGGRLDLRAPGALGLLGCGHGPAERGECSRRPLRLLVPPRRRHGGRSGQALGVPIVVTTPDRGRGLRFHRPRSPPSDSGRRRSPVSGSTGAVRG